MHTTSPRDLPRSASAALFLACAAGAAFGLVPASAEPAGDPIDAVLVPVAGANEVYGHEFTSSPVNNAPSEPEKAIGDCGNAQASAFSGPWTSYRSVHYSTYNNLGPTQRVARYADEAAAAQAFSKLISQLATCKTAAAPAPQAATPTQAATSSPQAGEQPADQSQAPTSSAQQPAAGPRFTVASAGGDAAKWDDYVGFSHVSGMPFHCYREARQHAAFVVEVETCDLDDNGSLTSAMAQKMLSQIPA